MTKLYGALIASVLLLIGCSESPDTEVRDGNRPGEVSNATAEPPGTGRTILFLGNSLSAGLGVAADSAFPALIQHRIDSLGWNFTVVNAGLSGDTSSGGLRRLSWLLRQPVDVMILELGANDGLRGIPPDAMHQNLASIIDQTRDAYPQVQILLAGMEMPPNLGPVYTQSFRRVYQRLADEKDIVLIPFLLDGVGGVRDFNLPDGIHPNEAGHRIVAETVWAYLRPVLVELRSADVVADALR